MGRIYDTCTTFNPPTHLFFHPIFLPISHIQYQTFLNNITNLFIFLQKISSEELVNMPTCNPLKTMHNVWLQQSGKRRACLYGVTSDDYVRTFKNLTLNSHFKQGGQLDQGFHKSELLLHKVT
jgi:hypothetical protein